MKQYTGSQSGGSTGQGGDYMKQYAGSYTGGSTGQGGDYMKQYTGSHSGGSTGESGDYMKQYAGYMNQHGGSKSGGSTCQGGDYMKEYAGSYMEQGNDASQPTENISHVAESDSRPDTPLPSTEFAAVTRQQPHGRGTKFVLCVVAGFSLPAALAFVQSRRVDRRRSTPLEGDGGYHPLV